MRGKAVVITCALVVVGGRADAQNAESEAVKRTRQLLQGLDSHKPEVILNSLEELGLNGGLDKDAVDKVLKGKIRPMLFMEVARTSRGRQALAKGNKEAAKELIRLAGMGGDLAMSCMLAWAKVKQSDADTIRTLQMLEVPGLLRHAIIANMSGMKLPKGLKYTKLDVWEALSYLEAGHWLDEKMAQSIIDLSEEALFTDSSEDVRVRHSVVLGHLGKRPNAEIKKLRAMLGRLIAMESPSALPFALACSRMFPSQAREIMTTVSERLFEINKDEAGGARVFMFLDTCYELIDGNTGTVLTQLLGNENRDVRYAAASILYWAGKAANGSFVAIKEFSERSKDEEARVIASRLLGRVGDIKKVGSLRMMIESEQAALVRKALEESVTAIETLGSNSLGSLRY